MLTNFTELKTKAAAEKEKCYPKGVGNCGVALLSKNGKIFVGHSVIFSDNTKLDAVDMAVYSALSEQETKFLAGAICGDVAPDKKAMLRLSQFSDLMLSINIGQTSTDTTLKKLLFQLGDTK